LSQEVESVDVFVFSSENITNIWAGYGAGTWAVSSGESTVVKSKRTKSARLIPGSLGILYCAPWKAFTMPFVTTTIPDVERVERDIWHGEWILPFKFRSLGNPMKRVNSGDTYEIMDGIKRRKINNFSNYLNVQSNFDFQPSRIDKSDWAKLVERLAVDA
jgi:hypothetical protein